MPKILKPLNIIQEETPSEVFFSMLKCLKGDYARPSLIAEDIKMSPSSVTDNLNKLIKAGIVNKPQVVGREWLYSPNWLNLMKLCKERYEKESELQHLTECLRLKNKLKAKELNDILNELENEEFADFLKEYFIEISKDIFPDTIDNVIEDIESRFHRWERMGNDKLSLIFKKWGKLISKHQDLLEKAFWNTLKSSKKRSIHEIDIDKKIKEQIELAEAFKDIDYLIRNPVLVCLDVADTIQILSSGLDYSATSFNLEMRSAGFIKCSVLKVLNKTFKNEKYNVSGIILTVRGNENMTLEKLTFIGETIAYFFPKNINIIFGANVVENKSNEMLVRILTVKN